ncbi:HNH endonuclease [Spirosoma pulveris]
MKTPKLAYKAISMKNPSWQRDELILALDLYFTSDYNKLNNTHSDIINLSQLLNKLSIFSKHKLTETFRNPEGVYMKLGNFLAIDPNDTRKGLPKYGKLDEIVFYEFKDNIKELSLIANTIRQSILDNKTYELLNIENNSEEIEEISVKEGKVIYHLHKIRERNATLIKKKKKQALNKFGRLQCEVCNFDFKNTYGDLGEGFIECHHTKPISQMIPEDITRLEDLALVCSNCHRMLHKDLSLSIKALKASIKSLI